MWDCKQKKIKKWLDTPLKLISHVILGGVAFGLQWALFRGNYPKMDDFGDFTGFGQFTAAQGNSIAAVDTSKGELT